MPPVWDVYITMFRGRDSITNVITNSPTVSEIFADEQVASRRWKQKSLASLGMAPHRFNSMEKPVVRGALLGPELLSSAVTLWQLRGPTSREGRIGVEFIKWFSVKKGLINGAMADGGSEALKVTRHLEPESCDTATFQESAELFLKSCVVLFSHKKALTFGFMAYSIDRLKGNDLFLNLPNGDGKIIQGKKEITTALIDEVLLIMQEWTRLLYLTIRAENPAFEAVQSFRVLALQSSVLKDAHDKQKPAFNEIDEGDERMPWTSHSDYEVLISRLAKIASGKNHTVDATKL